MPVNDTRTAPIVLLALLRRVAIDQRQDTDFLSERDRVLGSSIDFSASRYSQLVQWLQQLDKSHLEALERRSCLMQLIALCCGVLLGVSVTLASVIPRGGEPVNLLLVLTMLVGIPLLLMTVAILFVMPAQLLDRIPFVSRISSTVERIVPFDSIRLLAERILFSQSEKEFVSLYRAVGIAGYRRWFALYFTQTIGLAFSIASCLTFLCALLFVDVAFVWSSTYSFEVESFYSVLKSVATPWSAILPAAVPTMELVEHTRFFTLQSDFDRPELYGAWWPFVLCCIVFYSLIPRLILWVFAAWRLQSVAQKEIWNLPGAQVALLRVQGVQTQTSISRSQNDPVHEESVIERRVEHVNKEDIVPEGLAFVWALQESDPVGVEAIAILRERRYDILHLGGRRKELTDGEVAQLIQNSEKPRVLFVAKSWEPPTREVITCIQEISKSCGPEKQMSILFVLLPVTQRSKAQAENDIEVWRASVPEELRLEVLRND